MKIYVASSWKNQIQPEIVSLLRDMGHEVYDFKNPRPEDTGFHWSEIDPKYQSWTPEWYMQAVDHPIAREGFASDMIALEDCDCCVLVLPCGRSAHLEAGYAIGAGKPTVILLTEGLEPELMYLMTEYLCVNTQDLIDAVNGISEELRRCRVCDCTENNACLGDCYWVEYDLCSSCVGKESG